MEDPSQQLTSLLAHYADTLGVPVPALGIAGLLVIGLVGHVLIQWLLRRAARAADRSQTPWDDVLVSALAKPGEWAMWVVLLYGALGFVGSSVDDLRVWLRQVADLGVIILLGWMLHRLLASVEAELLAEHRGKRDSDQRATISATARLLRICLWIVVALTMLQAIGVSISGLLAFGGIGGIAVGFAARDLLANFLGGLSIFMDRPFTVGDWIRSPDREIEGTVESIGWRMTMIRTFDQRPLYVPNAIFSSVAIENPSRMRNRRIYETFGIRYGDVSKMAAIVDAVKRYLEEHKDIDLGRTLIVNFVSCAPSSLDFFVYTFTRTTDWVEYHRIKQAVMLDILSIIEEHGAEVAFPTRTLHLAEDQLPPTGEGSALPRGNLVSPES